MLELENTYTDIFTEYDESVFSDGSIDPMGLRIIWTSLGNNIFKNRLNTISTDIRLYTINLFHHYIIQQYEQKNQLSVNNLIYKSPYHNRVDLHDGIIIFLESLLTQVVYRLNIEKNKELSVPGISKLTNIIKENQNSDKANILLVSSSAGILVRHILLGIHGRHKGPFRQMNIFKDNNYYYDREVWKTVAEIFTGREWNKLKELLTDIFDNHIFNSQKRKDGYIYAFANEIIDKKLKDAYSEILKDEVFRDEKLINFWEEKLGLNSGAAKLLYNELKNTPNKTNYENIIRSASTKGNSSDNRYIKAICVIEPFISRIEKISHKLLNRGVNSISEELKEFILKALNDEKIDLDSIKKYLNDDFLSREALRRTKALFDIYANAKNNYDAVGFIQDFIKYHKKLMEERGNMQWISIGEDNNITQHRSLIFSNDYINKLTEDNWINNYYLSTVLSLYKGLYQK